MMDQAAKSQWSQVEVKGAEPHVTSLLELHQAISHGVVLHSDHSSLSAVAVQVVDHMVASQRIRAEDHGKILRALQHSLISQPLMAGGGCHGDGRLETNRKEEKLPEKAEASVMIVATGSFLEQPSLAFVRLQEAVNMESVALPVRFLFLLLAPPTAATTCHLIGQSISTLMSDKNFLEVVSAAERQDLFSVINSFLREEEEEQEEEEEEQEKEELDPDATFQKESADHEATPAGVKAPPLAPPPDPLRRSGRLCGGLIRDAARRFPQYASDLRDAANTQVMAAIVFIYFAALTPAVTFGGLLGEKTDGLIGVSELIVATAMQGVVFSLLGAQPLLIVGFSGPLLVFEEAFYSFCRLQQVDYLAGRVWVGFWLVLIVGLTVALEGSFLVRYVSRFTQEIFSFLISLIFIYETFAKLIKIFQEHPLGSCSSSNSTTLVWEWNCGLGVIEPNITLLSPPSRPHRVLGEPNTTLLSPPSGPHRVLGEPNTALLSLVHMAGTFLIAFYLRKFKNSVYFPGRLRRLIGDFGVPIAILVMVLVDISLQDTYTQKLSVPRGLSVSSPEKRGWLISPLGTDGQFPVWMMICSFLPALLLFILIFMESQITALIVSKKERMLVKGSGFHLDLLIVVAMGGFSALLGLPWLSAATVRSVTHTNALTVTSRTTHPGEKPGILEVKEQRVSGLVVALLVGLSIVMGDVLQHIPLAVLFGVFLYMGVMSLHGIELTERILLMIKAPKHHGNHGYGGKVSTVRMHLFTGVQLLLVSALWLLMTSAAALLFPFLLLCCAALRCTLLHHMFSTQELQALDGDAPVEQDTVSV